MIHEPGLMPCVEWAWMSTRCWKGMDLMMQARGCRVTHGVHVFDSGCADISHCFEVVV